MKWINSVGVTFISTVTCKEKSYKEKQFWSTPYGLVRTAVIYTGLSPPPLLCPFTVQKLCKLQCCLFGGSECGGNFQPLVVMNIGFWKLMTNPDKPFALPPCVDRPSSIFERAYKLSAPSFKVSSRLYRSLNGFVLMASKRSSTNICWSQRDSAHRNGYSGRKKYLTHFFLTMLYLFRELNSFRQSVMLQKENLSTYQTQA